MRSIRPITAFAAAATVLALAPAGASAAHGPKLGTGPCRLTELAEPHIAISGESGQVFGQLICGPSSVGQTVTVYEHAAGGSLQVLGTATTGAAGFYSIVAPALTTNTTFYSTAAGLKSPMRVIRVSPQVSLAGPPESKAIITGRRGAVIFSGTVSPADAGAEVVLQRENSSSFEEWHVIQIGIVSRNGAYSFTHVFSGPGEANIRAVVRAHRKISVRGVSNALSYTISQAENPRLTLNTTASQITFGQSSTLSGVVAGAVSQPVTLWSRELNGVFAVAAKGTTDSTGKYSFPQAPQHNTVYRVTSGAVSSALLVQGVKFLLTANASGTSVPSGGTLTFSGTVSPAIAGHVVYLQRENTGGGPFNVVDVGTVAADGSYSITHVMIGAGKGVFRVKIPGGPNNQAASSQLFNIEITPAVPILGPLPQSKLPGEGKV